MQRKILYLITSSASASTAAATRRMGSQGIRETGRYGTSGDELLRLDVGRADDFTPLLGFFGNERPEMAGELARIMPPRSESRAFILGSAGAALISLLSFSTIAPGVFAGTPTPK